MWWKIFLGVAVIELLLAFYFVPIANSNLILIAGMAAVLVFTGLLFAVAALMFSASANNRVSEIARAAIAANTQVAGQGLLLAGQVSAQAASLIEERVNQGVRLWQYQGRYVLEVPGYSRYLDARSEAGMSQADIDYMAQAQLPLLEAENEQYD